MPSRSVSSGSRTTAPGGSSSVTISSRIALAPAVQLREHAPQLGEIGLGCPLCGQPRRLRLERDAHLTETGEVADVDLRHEHAAPWEHLDESFLREPP